MSRSGGSGASQIPNTPGRPFADGNSGRPRGSKNRSTLLAAALLEGEAEELVRKAVALAKAGDVGMLKFLLGRILPRERLIKLEMRPMVFADDAIEALGHIVHSVSEGRISAGEGASLASLLNSFREALDQAEVVKRIDAIEAQLIKVHRGL